MSLKVIHPEFPANENYNYINEVSAPSNENSAGPLALLLPTWIMPINPLKTISRTMSIIAYQRLLSLKNFTHPRMYNRRIETIESLTNYLQKNCGSMK